MWRTKILAAILLAALILLAVYVPFAVAQTVSAEGLRAHLGRSEAHVLRNRAIICDHNRNGIKEDVHYYRRGHGAVRSEEDKNGADPGCGRGPREHGRITDMRICWFNQYTFPNRCGDWVSR